MNLATNEKYYQMIFKEQDNRKHALIAANSFIEAGPYYLSCFYLLMGPFFCCDHKWNIKKVHNFQDVRHKFILHNFFL